MNTIVSNPPRTWQYLLAITLPAVVMIAALGINTHLLYLDIKHAESEQQGLQHLPSLLDLSITLQKIRSVTQLQRHGETSLNREIELLKKQLKDQLASLQQSPRSEQLGLMEALAQLEQQAINTLDAAEINTPQEIFLSHSALIEHSIEIMELAAEHSALKYDSDPKNFLLANLASHQINKLTESIGRVRGLGGGLILNERVGNSRQLIQELHVLRNNLNKVQSETGKILSSDSPDEMRLAHLMETLYQSGDQFISRGEQLLSGIRPVNDPISFFSEGSRTVDESLLLFTAARDLLDQRLTSRIIRTKQTIYYAAFGALLAILLMTFFIFNFYRKNTTAFGELESSIASLYDSEAKNRAIINSAVDGVITIDERGIIMSANPSAEQLFGYSAPEMIGNNVDMLMPDPHQSNHDGYLRRYLGTGKRKIIGIGREALGMRKDGSCFPIELSVSEAPHQGKRIFTGTVHDISKRKQIENELDRHKHHLENIIQERSVELNALHNELRQFTNSASQNLMKQLLEIKKQIRPIVQTDLPQDLNNDHAADANLATEQLRYSTITDKAASIDQICEQLLWQVNTIIKLSGASLQKLHLETINMEIVADNLKQSAKTQLDMQQAHVNIGSLPVIYSDRRAIEQILSRLFNNAIDQLTPERPGIIEINAEHHDGEHYFYIRDNGRGIAPDEIPQLFNPFVKQGSKAIYRTELAYAQYLVRRLGGQLNCQSILDEGSLFSFSLPVRNNQAPPASTDEATQPSSNSADDHAIAS